MPASFEDLVALMSRLRAPDGCPWDREQTYATLAPMLLEEAYEAFDAVEDAREGRPLALRDELGDLLFQIVFYAQVAAERGEFSIADVVEQIHAKMVRRHPHVFGDATVRDNEELLRNWEAMKAEEKRAAGREAKADDSSLLDGVSARLPALMESHQLATKAARVGFDWQSVEAVFDKLHEEIEELREAIREHGETPRAGAAGGSSGAGALPDDESAPRAEADDARLREELGDVIFAVSNIARHLGVDPEAALKLTNRKFRRRFRHVERGLRAAGREPGSATLDEMEALWQEAKKSDE
jgi:MazG family protein